MIWAFLYIVGGIVIFIWWKIECYREDREVDYSTRYYSQSQQGDNGLMLIFCLIGWPFIALMFFQKNNEIEDQEPS